MPAFQILDVMVKDADDEGYIRTQAENDIFKYIVINPNTLGYEVPPARSKIAAQLSQLPSGNWTTIRLSRNADGQLELDLPQ
jgi:hypothetical protein